MGQPPIINILTSRLPGNVTRPIYLEYNVEEGSLTGYGLIQRIIIRCFKIMYPQSRLCWQLVYSTGM